MATASSRACMKSRHRLLDYVRLVGDLREFDADRQFGVQSVPCSRLQIVAELETSPSLDHRHGEADRILAAVSA